VRNPLVLASALGVVLAVTGSRLPEVLEQPIEMIGGMAVPGALIVFGMSLYGAPLPGRGGGGARLVAISVLKLAVLPAVAYLVGRWVFGLAGTPLLAVTLCAALPTAQNIFVYAMRYRVGVGLARDAVVSTTLACIPVLIAIVALVHR
jgi:predicted permease